MPFCHGMAGKRMGRADNPSQAFPNWVRSAELENRAVAHKEPTWSQCDHYAGERVRHLRCVLVEAIPGPGSVKNTSIRQVNGGVSFGCICAHPYPKGTRIANYVA